MTEAPRLRLFVAVDVPRPLLEAIDAATQHLHREWTDARWAPVDNQHVTLKFLGPVAQSDVDGVTTVLRGVAARHEPAELGLDSLGVFPSPRRARVFWVGLDDPAGALPALAADLDAALQPLGFEAETRAFRAHLTLARLKAPRALPEGAGLGEVPVRGRFDVDRMVLYRSHLSPKGARYKALAAFPLGSDGGGADL